MRCLWYISKIPRKSHDNPVKMCVRVMFFSSVLFSLPKEGQEHDKQHHDDISGDDDDDDDDDSKTGSGLKDVEVFRCHCQEDGIPKSLQRCFCGRGLVERCCRHCHALALDSRQGKSQKAYTIGDKTITYRFFV